MTANLRIAALAANPAVHRAFQWLHLHEPQLRKWQLEILRIPAPPFGEAARAAWFLSRFAALNLTHPHLDAAGNALATLPSRQEAESGGEVEVKKTVIPTGGGALAAAVEGPPHLPSAHTATHPHILLSAHLDTVFPSTTPTEPLEQETRILAPGACDNAAGLTALLAIAAALQHAQLAPAAPILFAANVGEEGEGNLRGMRHLFNLSPENPNPNPHNIAAAIALEGSGSSAVITQALASRRFRVTVIGPGGHAWTDAGAPNPILLLARALLALESIPTAPPAAPGEPAPHPRTTLNVGLISGGTSINSIPSSANALLDLRSTTSAALDAASLILRQTLTQTIPTPALTIDLIGDRPGGVLPGDSPLLATLRAVDRHLNLRTEPSLGSTDANIPLSLSIPAIAIGAGGTGGGIHTLNEWYDPTNRTLALRRILLTLLDTAHLAAAPD
ncbi:MAG: M20/M25/M40 family metallo-hydrolase [Acidobacteriaceae bacterium]|jgi:acetylornithine deacetylase/succinyl-diaminopimelate desuccinylase-like protein